MKGWTEKGDDGVRGEYHCVGVAQAETRWAGRGTAEPTGIRIGREIAGKVGNSKKVVIRQTRRFSQVWTEMVVLPFTLLTFVVNFF